MKEVERLKKEILKENEELGLSAEGWDEEQDHVLEVDENVIPPLTRPEKTEGDDSDTLSAHHSETANVLEDEVVLEESTSADKKLPESDQIAACDGEGLAPETGSAPQELSKREKRKLREARKAQAAETGKTAAQACNVCNESFNSRTKLFNHIRDTGHALAQADDTTTIRNYTAVQFPLIYPINCETSSGGYFVCENVKSRFRL